MGFFFYHGFSRIVRIFGFLVFCHVFLEFFCFGFIASNLANFANYFMGFFSTTDFHGFFSF